MISLHKISLAIGFALAFAFHTAAEVVPVWSTGVAVPGEQVMLYLVDTELGEDTFVLPKAPQPRGATVQLQQPTAGANPLDPDRAMVEILPILVRADKVGQLDMGEVTVEYRSGRKQTVKLPPLQVLSTSEIKWYNSPVPYGALWYTTPKEGYVHQPVRTALKLFLPQDCFVPSLPQLHAVGVKVSTLQPALQGVVAMIQSRLMENTRAFARGQFWSTSDFVGEVTPFREGNSDITGKVLIARQRGFFTMGQEEVPLPTLSLSALPLPPGAPPPFADTVGNYTISSGTNATSLAMNEAVEVEITVRGSGNLQQLACPPPDDAANWKLVPATRKPIVSASGETVGMAFTQLMRPVAEVDAIPSFVLSYFDPSSMSYKQATTTPVPLPWRETDSAGNATIAQAVAPPPAGTVPVAELTDIYDYLPIHASRRLWQLPRYVLFLLYLPALVIIAVLTTRCLMRRLALHAADRARERELTAISREPEDLSFLKRIGSFIEVSVPAAARDAETEQILKRRDDEAFRPGAMAELNPAERAAMLRSVRKALARAAGKATLLLLALLPLTHATDDPAGEAYRSRQYTKALEQLQQTCKKEGPHSPRADLLHYNIGNCFYRLGKPGQAALHYARALQVNPSFPEARANLDFIQRKEGAVLPVRDGANRVFTLLNFSQLRLTSIVCTAGLAFCLALLLVCQRGRAVLIALSSAGALLSLLCLLDWVYYTTRETPDFSSLPSADLAYVTQESTLRNAATEDAAGILRLTPSSPLHLLAKRGSFCYVETSTGVRGWAPTESIAPLMDDGSVPPVPLFIQFL